MPMLADKEEVRARSDIAEIASGYVALKRRGRSLVGLCPFHQEKTPSFHVDTVSQSYKCFGCGESGDVFRFIERLENLSFLEAAEFLARRAGVELKRQRGHETAESRSEREELFALNATARDYFRNALNRVESAQSYLQGRGLGPEILDRFAVGFAPEGWDNLTGYLESRRADLRLAEKAGLVHAGSGGGWYDVFRERIVFPILDEQDRVVGFGGRAMGDDPPKYLNTGETPLFAKSRLLYGLSFARKEIAKEGRALLMEGYIDVISAHQAGFRNAVAALGTALTEQHAAKLARTMPNNPLVLLVYDADAAGVKATLRASELLEAAGARVHAVTLPEGEDPDSLLRQEGGAGRFREALAGARGRVEYLLDRVVGDANPEDPTSRAEALRKVVYVLSGVPTRAERDAYLERVWRLHPLGSLGPAPAMQRLHEDAEDLARQRRRAESRKSSAAPVPSPPAAVSPIPLTMEQRAERQLLLALFENELRPLAQRLASPGDFQQADIRLCFIACSDLPADEISAAELLQHFGQSHGDEALLRLRELLQETRHCMANDPVNPAVVENSARFLQKRKVLAQQSEFRERLSSDLLEESDTLRRFERQQAELTGSDGQRKR